MTPLLWTLTGLAVLLVSAALLISWKLSTMILYPKAWQYDAVLDQEITRGAFTREWYDATVRLTDFTLRSPAGYDLHCARWPHPEGASFADGKARVVVLAHGFTYALHGGIKYARHFHELGFDCVFFDHRGHGLSGKAPVTMGLREADDLAAVCNWAFSEFGEDTVLGTHGESMGAATVMLHAPLEPRLAFAVEDCGFSSLKEELRFVVRTRYRLPAGLILPFAGIFSRLRGGVLFSRVNPAAALQSVFETPMLFMHGEQDSLVPFFMARENYDAKPGEKAFRSFPEAKHAESACVDPVGYREALETFLTEHGIV